MYKKAFKEKPHIIETCIVIVKDWIKGFMLLTQEQANYFTFKVNHITYSLLYKRGMDVFFTWFFIWMTAQSEFLLL